MFSSEDKLKERMGKDKVGRFDYLKQLVNEFKITQSQEAKHQVLGNLANFAYDPINYEHLRTLGVLDLFLEQLCENDATLTQFALGGICNLALEAQNKNYINSNGGIAEISKCLYSSSAETVMYAVTSLMFLMSVKYKAEITSEANIKRMLELAKHSDKRVQNLAVIFLEDYCDRNQVQILRTSEIPLPSTSQTQLPVPEETQCTATEQ